MNVPAKKVIAPFAVNLLGLSKRVNSQVKKVMLYL
jgi:NOL1/NOP2/fmu family ribosome biogenesis protein